MKTFNQLSERQQELACQRRFRQLLQGFCDGTYSFADPKMQAHITASAAKADEMKTPWFIHEYVMETPAAEALRRIATDEVVNLIYLEPGEVAMAVPEEPND